MSTLDKYITVVIHAGHANRIFMIGAAMYIAKLTNRKFVVIDSLIQPNSHEKDSCMAFKKFMSLLPKFDGTFAKQTEYCEKAYCEPLQLAVNKILNVDDNLVVLCGYFQTRESLHENLRELLMESFNEVILQSTPLPNNKFFIHVRRGDYIDMGLLDLKFDFASKNGYYNKAIEYCRSMSNEEQFPIVISDDPEWCKTQNIFKGMQILQKGSAMQALLEMSKCTGAVCANSTMSYIGSWLQNPRGTIIMPRIWFGESYAQTQLEKGNFWPDYAILL